MSRKQGKRRRKAWWDFWHAWREEQERLWGQLGSPPWEAGHPMHSFPPAEMARAWRAFFHEFMGAFPEDHWAFGGRRFNPWHQGIDVFNPFVAALLSKGGGLLPLYVLHLLAQQPRYGNELMEIIRQRTRGQWVANPGAIYPLMTMLEKRGLVEGEWEDPHKRTVRIYTLTSDGEKEMKRLKAVVRPKLEEAVAVLQELAQDLDGSRLETDELETKEVDTNRSTTNS